MEKYQYNLVLYLHGWSPSCKDIFNITMFAKYACLNAHMHRPVMISPPKQLHPSLWDRYTQETVTLPAPTHTQPKSTSQLPYACLIQTDNTKRSAKKQSVIKRASVICYEQVF